MVLPNFQKTAWNSVVDPGFSWGAPTAKVGVQTYYFAENCMKMKEFGPPGSRVPGAPLDPPLKLTKILAPRSANGKFYPSQHISMPTVSEKIYAKARHNYFNNQPKKTKNSENEWFKYIYSLNITLHFTN